MQRKKVKGHKRQTGYELGFALAALFVLAVALYISGGIGVYKPDPARKIEIEQNTQRLYALENAPVVDLDEEARLKYRAMLDARDGILVDDLAAEQARIVALEDWSKADFARWFNDAAIVGDSISVGIYYFNWLNTPPVFAEIGVKALDNLPMLNDVEAASPSVIFLCFGMNDLGRYGSRVDSFIEQYTKLVQRLQRSLPNAVIYINAVFPIADKAVRQHSKYQNVDLYNEGIRQMCRELGVYYVDSGFIPKQLPELIEQDGIHMKTKFYPRWLTYLADVSGLSKDDEQ